MRVTPERNGVQKFVFCPARCVGYTVREGTTIELDARDLRIMARLGRRDPKLLADAIAALAHRFPDNIVFVDDDSVEDGSMVDR